MDHHEKLAWSAQHLHALDLEIKDFVQRHPFRARGYHRHGTRTFDVIVEGMPLLPRHWPLMAGDAIHNMRSALDYLIWALIEKSPTKPNDRQSLKVGYPICLSYGQYWGVGDQFPKNGMRGQQAQWIGDDALALVDATQPYHMNDLAHEHPLAVIAAYSNEDKHRNLVAGAVLATSVQFTIRQRALGPFTLGGFVFHTSEEWRWLYNGANLGTVEFDEGTTCDGMEVEPNFRGTIAFRKAADQTMPPISVGALEKVLYAIHEQIVAPLDAVLDR